jgi:hypothetical protein
MNTLGLLALITLLTMSLALGRLLGLNAFDSVYLSALVAGICWTLYWRCLAKKDCP